MVFEQIHLWSLEASGRGSPFSDGVSHILSWLATSVMTTVLVLIGYGWTITSDSLGKMINNTGAISIEESGFPIEESGFPIKNLDFPIEKWLIL